MHPLLVVPGTALVLTALVDMLWTTIAVSGGGGPLTSSVSRRLWQAFCHLARRSRHPHRFLRLAGVAVVVAVFSVWVVLFVTGWWLIFAAHPHAVLDATSGAPADWLGRLYFAGFTTSTLGVGDVVAGGGIWRALTVVAAFSGLSVVTMSITYLVPVAAAVVDRRTLALTLTSLGSTPQELLVRAWDGAGWSHLEERLPSLTRDLGTLGQRHLAYPVLHYFHDLERDVAAPVSIAVLDEALTILRFGVAPDARPADLVLEPSRTCVASFLSTLSVGHIAPADDVPPPPSLASLRAAGIPTVDDGTFAAAVADLEERRRLLLGFVRDDGWAWDLDGGDADEQQGDDEGGDDASPEEVESDEDAA